MKEVQPLSRDQIVIEKQAEQEKQNKLLGRIIPKKGHTIFEVNLVTGDVDKAKFQEETLVVKDLASKAPENEKVKRIMVNKHCIYISSLNVENLKKKLKKMKLIND